MHAGYLAIGLGVATLLVSAYELWVLIKQKRNASKPPQ